MLIIIESTMMMMLLMAGKFKPNNFITLSLLLKFVKRIRRQTLDSGKDYYAKDCRTIGSGAAR